MNDAKHNTHPPLRRIRSFVRREGRLTPGQQRALERSWPRFGLEFDAPFDAVEAFGRRAPLTLEIGFGNGASLAQMAANEPEADFIGIEVHRPGVGHLLQELETRGPGNVRIFCHDAVEVLERKIPDRCLDRALLFFPDPWPKRKHHKRRILQPAFVALIAAKLKSGGIFHMATDWQPYADQMLDVMQASAEFINCSATGTWSERPPYRPV
ncbi:MAG: tRNA (guanosine(46)-N7)-methyltransferase TrmB, partial [Thiogranum sp.]|nr:tRNA (guanosine(46)-N7)-methyltransferase TrmB [Thiogranum sp.]